MSEPTITAEDLTLYALQLLEGEEAEQVDLLLHSSSEAREELARIRGDLSLFAMGTELQAPNPLTRQRFLKQVARERRTAPVTLPDAPEQKSRPAVPTYVPDPLPTADPRDLAGASWTPSRERPFAVDNAVAPVAPVAPIPAWRSEQSVDRPSPQRIAREDAPARTDPTRLEPTRSDYGSLPATSFPDELFQDEDHGRDKFVPTNFAFTSFETSEEKQTEGTSRWFAWTGWAVAAVLAAAGAFAVRQNFALRRQVAFGTERASQAEASAARAQLVMQTIQSGATQRFVLAKTDAAPVPSGRVAYLPERGTLIFQGSNLEPLAPYKTYELWLIPTGEGKQPVPAGTFKPDVRGYASVVLPQMPKGIVAGNFGVTIEDEGGASAPTLPILLIGQQS